MKKQRNAIFDIAKFLAIILVVLGHLLNECTGDPTFLINFFHMPVLFFISGYFGTFSLQKYALKEIAANKIKSLLIPYLFWSGVSLAANMALSLVQGTFSQSGIFQEALQIFLYARSVWFLVELLVSFLVFLAVHGLVQKMGMQRYAATVQMAVWLLLSMLLPGEFFAFYKFKWLYPFFLAGWVTAKNQTAIMSWLNTGKRGSVLRAASLLFPVLVYVCLNETAFWEYTQFTYTSLGNTLYGVLYYLISLVGVGFMLTVSCWISRCALSRTSAEIGTYSLDIYVIHMFIVKVVQIVFSGEGMNTLAVYGIFSVISLLIVVSIWLMSKYFLRKINIFRIVVGLPVIGKR